MDPYTDQPESTENQGFHALMRFLRVVMRHRLILIGLIATAAFLAVVRHQRLPKQYESSTRLMIRQPNVENAAVLGNYGKTLLTRYRQFLLSDSVLVNTVESLSKKPPELAGITEKHEWPYVLREQMLSVAFSEEDDVVTVKCRSRDAESTARVIRALTTASMRFMRNDQQEEARDTVKRLDSEAQQIQARFMELQQQQLQARKECGDLAISEHSDQSHPQVQRVSRLNDTLTNIRQRRIELDAMRQATMTQISANGDLTVPLQKLSEIIGEEAVANVAGTTNNKAANLQKMEDELAVLIADYQGRRQHFGSGHAEIQRREAEIKIHQSRVAQARASRREEVNAGLIDPQIGRRLLNTITAELNATRHYESALDREYQASLAEAQTLSGKLASIRSADLKLETLREVHSSLLTRLNSISIQPDDGGTRPTVLTEPLVPEHSVYPVLTYAMAIFCATATALGLGIIYVVDLLDDRLRSPEEVREELRLPVLGIIRKLPDEEVEQSNIYVHSFAQTPHAECFRTLKTSISMSAMDTKCIAVTSSEASEGKTTTTVNLAASYAQTGVRTLLIDADMRRPGLSRLLDVRTKGGLSEILRAKSDIPQACEQRVVSTEVPLLDVLPCGPRILNAGMLLSMPSLADMLDWAMSEYDQVIIDCPPTLPVSDAAIVGRYVDGLLFVMNPDKTHRRSVTRAVDQLRSMGLKIIGIVANTSLSEEKNSYGYQYGYGYGHDYSYGHDIDSDPEGSPFGDDSETEKSAFGKAA